MPTREDGEFEVLLGNRQLLSVFFIVVILLAVFFTMGYVLGRSSGPASVAVRPAAPSPPPAAEKPASTFAEVPAAPPVVPPVVDAAPKAEPKPAAPSGPVTGETYLQVIAARGPEAELVKGVLKKKGFRALIAPGPTDAVARVLVGPFTDTNDMLKTRTGLEKAGFKPIVRKY
jgi:cell division protein FtsN